MLVVLILALIVIAIVLILGYWAFQAVVEMFNTWWNSGLAQRTAETNRYVLETSATVKFWEWFLFIVLWVLIIAAAGYLIHKYWHWITAGIQAWWESRATKKAAEKPVITVEGDIVNVYHLTGESETYNQLTPGLVARRERDGTFYLPEPTPEHVAMAEARAEIEKWKAVAAVFATVTVREERWEVLKYLGQFTLGSNKRNLPAGNQPMLVDNESEER